jgi:phosphotransferase family enzyme
LSFSTPIIADLIKKVESIIGRKERRPQSFISLEKKNLYINKKLLIRYLFRPVAPEVYKSHLSIYPKNIKEKLRLLNRLLFQRGKFASSADIIKISANLNLFYINRGIRVKIFVPGRVRTTEQFKNEIFIRENIKKSGLLPVPKLLDYHLNTEIYFFIDEIVYGDILPWSHPKAFSIFKRLIPRMWKYYQSNGIVWNTPEKMRIDIHKAVEDYNHLIIDSKYNIDFDIKKIKTFSDKLIPCSIIHGDLNVENIIVTPEKYYIIDWELSRHDFIIFDFIKILLLKEWNFREDIEKLMEGEIKDSFGNYTQRVLSFSDQCLLAFFLDVCDELKKSDASLNRLERFEQQFKRLHQ